MASLQVAAIPAAHPPRGAQPSSTDASGAGTTLARPHLPAIHESRKRESPERTRRAGSRAPGLLGPNCNRDTSKIQRLATPAQSALWRSGGFSADAAAGEQASCAGHAAETATIRRSIEPRWLPRATRRRAAQAPVPRPQHREGAVLSSYGRLFIWQGYRGVRWTVGQIRLTSPRPPLSPEPELEPEPEPAWGWDQSERA